MEGRKKLSEELQEYFKYDHDFVKELAKKEQATMATAREWYEKNTFPERALEWLRYRYKLASNFEELKSKYDFEILESEQVKRINRRPPKLILGIRRTIKGW